MTDIIDTIADNLVEDHIALMNECKALRDSNAELLEALAIILYHFVPRRGTLRAEDDAIKQAHAAIARAKGEQA